MMKFNERLKELRIEKGLTQKELAQILNVDQRSISNWEKGIREPNFETLCQLALFFQTSTDYILGIANDEY